MDTCLYEVPARIGHQAVRSGCGRTEQPFPVGDRHAGDQAEQLRDGEAVGMGTHPGETVQDKHQRSGLGTISTARIGVF